MRIGLDVRLLYAPLLKGIGCYERELLLALDAIDTANEYVLFFDSRRQAVRRLAQHHRFIEKGISIPGDRFFLWEQVRLAREAKSVDVFHSLANTTFLAGACPRIVTVHDTKLLEV